jgi:MscS family membrane protein
MDVCRIVLLVCFSAQFLAAQQLLHNSSVLSDDPLGRSTPYGTVLGFVDAARGHDFDRAVEYVEIKPGQKGTEDIARELYLVVDRGLTVDLNMLSREPDGTSADQLTPTRYRVGTIDTSSGPLEIILDRVTEGSEEPIWLFSSDTLARISKISAEFQPPWIESHLPKRFVDARFLFMPVWRWIAIPLMVILVFATSWLLDRAFSWLLRPVVHRFIKEREEDESRATIARPILLLTFALQVYAIGAWGASLSSRQLSYRAATSVAIIATVWLICRVIEFLRQLMRAHLIRTSSTGRIALVRLFARLSKAGVIIVGILLLLYGWGFNLTAILTGVGIGGIAVAFAAQKTLDNLFGGIMLITDQPMRIGDLCKAGDHLGTVEDIGLRSTRIRTYDKTLVSIPNGQLATMSVENFSVRDRILFNPTIPLHQETTADQLRMLLSEMRRMLQNNSRLETRSITVRLVHSEKHPPMLSSLRMCW